MQNVHIYITFSCLYLLDSRTVSFTITSESLLLVDGNGNLVSATGEYSLTIEDGDLAKSGGSDSCP